MLALKYSKLPYRTRIYRKNRLYQIAIYSPGPGSRKYNALFNEIQLHLKDIEGPLVFYKEKVDDKTGKITKRKKTQM